LPASAPTPTRCNGAEKILGVPVIDHWWQTETGWGIAGNPMGLGALPVKYGSPTVPMPGYDVQVLDEGGKPVAPDTMGTIAIKLPLPPGCLPTLWQADERFRESYLTTFPGYYNTSDAGFLDGDGYVYVMGRTDDIINVAGHRLSTGGMEEVLASHPAVAECAVIGVKDALKGEVPCGFVVLKAGVRMAPNEVERELVALVRDRIGPVAAFKLALTVGRLPKTRSGKILRGTMKKIADGDAWAIRFLASARSSARVMAAITCRRMSPISPKVLRISAILPSRSWASPARWASSPSAQAMR
jgi:propionyl-CoA synthetase